MSNIPFDSGKEMRYCEYMPTARRGGFIVGIVAIIAGLASAAIGAAAVYHNPNAAKVALIDNPNDTTTAKTLQLKTLMVITLTPAPPPQIDGLVECGYPYNTIDNGRTSVRDEENEVLKAYSPKIAHAGDKLNVWGNDENAMMMGIRQIIINTPTGTTTKDYPITLLPGPPPQVTLNPQVGALYDVLPDDAGTDAAGRPIFPSLFITDITSNPADKSGDWQYGGHPVPPVAVFGSWKTAVKTIDRTGGSGDSVSFSSDENPSPKNVWNLGPGAVPAPPGLTGDISYGVLYQWDVNQLIAEGKMMAGHSYRVQYMVHDGDQSRGGDEGEACATVQLQ